MWGAIAALATRLFSAIGIQLASDAARFIAFKIFLTTIFVLVLPIVLNNLIVKVLSTIYSRASSAVSGEFSSHVVTLTGLAGYLAELLQLPLIVSVLLGAVSVKWTLRLLKLV